MNIHKITKQIRAFADELDAAKASEQPAPFSLPTPPPGIQWGTTRGWKTGDLPQGWRPFAKGEKVKKGDQGRAVSGGWAVFTVFDYKPYSEARTTRPLLFTHAGHEWTWHRAGDPRPCEDRRIYIMCKDGIDRGNHVSPDDCRWSAANTADIIGWRYADARLPIQTLAQEQIDATPEMQEAASRVLAEEMQLDPYAELKAAHAAGKAIEENVAGTFRCGADQPPYWETATNPSWSMPPVRYRIKPDDSPPWIEHNGGPCPLKDEEVEEWEYKCRNGGFYDWLPASGRLWDHDGGPTDIIAYRVLKARKPGPKQKLGPSDVPPNCAFRAPDWNPSIHVTPSLVAQDGVTWIRKLMISASASVEYMSFQSLKDAGWLINRPKNRDADGNPTLWEACER
jgi:hypothetical protein